MRNHLLTKAFGKHTKMILGYCSPQVGMVGAPRGPLRPSKKREGNGEIKDAIISFSFITFQVRKGEITEHNQNWTCLSRHMF